VREGFKVPFTIAAPCFTLSKSSSNNSFFKCILLQRFFLIV
jgi:hypothetical protein